MGIQASKTSFPFAGVSTRLPPSPPIHAGPFRLPSHILTGRKTASALFPRAPLRKAGVSVGAAGPGREHAAYGDPS